MEPRHETRPDAAAMALVAASAQRADRTLGDSGAYGAFAAARAPLERGATVGRYLVIDAIGSGGMGVVYAAYDPELNRKLALKLLRPSTARSRASGEILEARLLREAQTMASLSHPNVVHVYDVGVLGDQVFVAMEYIDGLTLGEWLRQEPRSIRAIVGAFRAAAQGLAAAHAAGMVHRDFKPDNVLVGRDGRVRVLDFGIARSAGAPEADEGGRDLGGLDGPAFGTLTKTGALVGTPAYMAPEQMVGEAVDARSDQFSFAVALYEALHGTRPFHGASLALLAAAVERGELAAGPTSRRVPARIARVLRKALAAKADDRFASMDALVAALDRDRGPPRRRGLAAALALAAVGAAFLIVRSADSRPPRACEGAGCSDAAALIPPRPSDPRERAQVEAIRARIAQARALDRAGDAVRAIAEATIGVRDARAITFRPVQAEALELLGSLQAARGDFDAAAATLEAALLAAQAGGDDAIAGRAAIALAQVVGARLGRFDQGLAWARLARATAERLGGLDEPALLAAVEAVEEQIALERTRRR